MKLVVFSTRSYLIHCKKLFGQSEVIGFTSAVQRYAISVLVLFSRDQLLLCCVKVFTILCASSVFVQ